MNPERVKTVNRSISLSLHDDEYLARESAATIGGKSAFIRELIAAHRAGKTTPPPIVKETAPPLARAPAVPTAPTQPAGAETKPPRYTIAKRTP